MIIKQGALIMVNKLKKIAEKSEITNLQGLPKGKYTPPLVKLIALINETETKEVTFAIENPGGGNKNIYGNS